jgi:hypothetical protein
VSRPGWKPLAALAQRTFDTGSAQSAELALDLAAGERLHLRVRTQLTPPQDPYSETLCVIFLQDLREAEARLRTEKLAAMGRMSAAVAHEIRNPLAAIAQANGLLAEELSDPGQQQLAALVGKNTQRLTPDRRGNPEPRALADTDDRLARTGPGVQAQVAEWQRHTAGAERVQLHLGFQSGVGRFRWRTPAPRAGQPAGQRHALCRRPQPGAIVVATDLHGAEARLQVWSNGGPLDPGVQRHLFEPFFSSEEPLQRTGPVHLPRVVRPPRCAHCLRARKGAGWQLPRGKQLQRDIPHAHDSCAGWHSLCHNTRLMPQAASPAHILVVDDEPDLRTLYELTLLREGYRVDAAATLAEAVQMLERQRFDAVITDMRLPGRHGPGTAATDGGRATPGTLAS